MSKPNHHPLLPLGLALVLIAVTAVFPFRWTRPAGPPKNPADVITTEIPISALPAAFNAAEEEAELEQLRKEGFKVGKTMAFRATPKPSRWETVISAATATYEVNAAYHTITDLDDDDDNDVEWRVKTYLSGAAIYGVINTHYGDDVWVTNKGQSGYYVFGANEKQSPLRELACAISPKLFALPMDGCRFSVPSQAIDYIFKNAFYEASKVTFFAGVPCALTTAGTGFCMGVTWASTFYGSLAWNFFEQIVFSGCAGQWGGPKPQDPAYFVIDGIPQQ